MTQPPDPADPRIISGEAWSRFTDVLDRARQIVLADGAPDSPRDRAEGLRYLTRFLAAGLATCVELADPDEPQLGRMVDITMPWGLDCPDCLYLYAAVRGDAQYRIWGNRGTANHIDIQVNYGHFALGDISQWGTGWSCNGFDLKTEPDGSFELLLRDLAPESTFLLIRQYFNDWEHERPADLYIERVGATYPAPPLRTDQLAARFDRLCMWLERGAALWEQMSRNALSMPPNTLVVHLPQNSDARAGMRGQAYGLGNFRCAPDEAVIVEFTPPRCHHWSVSLANYWWESIDFATRQSSLNGHQAVLDSDGVFRAVIAHEDPGVPNWLDTSGHTQGTIAPRFLLAEEAPVPQLCVLKFAEVRDTLPSDTPRVTPEHRAESLTRRRHAVLRRYRR